MFTLMTYAGPEDTAHVTRTGGVPLVPPGFEWPSCGECGLPMRFIAQLRLDELAEQGPKGSAEGSGTLAVWMCQNDPGMCDEWDPASGGNTARLFPAEAALTAAEPPRGETLVAASAAVAHQQVEAANYDEARGSWAESRGVSPRQVLGAWGGEPSWLQGEEVPECPACEGRMSFAAQLEEGHDHESDLGFGGGGCGYAFFCSPCGEAAFLWQC
ncbi:YwqG family protein [Streptomyces sp. XM4193]|uniref:DUF1963 domain-containing protein n=1 Tax=Streptomyces sp. XM4193 TaxID=2929782 RepID=UPI001FFBE9C4|nr:DUF1963 domain-containing protein [Streptomyces sp. XM4193]MCK1797635.1 YwqG family protein [Streptomyces sp. XM4193]